MSESKEARIAHAKKASMAASKSRTEGAAERIRLIVLAYRYMTGAKEDTFNEGRLFLINAGWGRTSHPCYFGADHTTAINTIAIRVGLTKKRIRQIIRAAS